MCVCVCVCVCVCGGGGNHENNVPSRLSPQWLCGNSCTWVITGRAHCFHDYIYITLILLL